MIVLISLHTTTTLLCLGLMGFIFFENRKNPLNQVSAIILGLLAIWNFSEIFADIPMHPKQIVMIFINIGTVGWIALLPAFYFLMLYMTNKIIYKTYLFLGFFFILSAIFFIVAQWTSGIIIKGVISSNTGWRPVWTKGFLFIIFLVYFYFTLGFSIFEYTRSYFSTIEAQKKKQINIVLKTALVILIVATIFDIVLPELLNKPNSGYTEFLALIWIAGISFGMNYYSLFFVSVYDTTESVIHTMSDAFFLLDEFGIIRSVNPAAAFITGYEKEDLLNTPFEMLISSESEITENDISDLIQVKKIKQLELELIAKKGTHVPVLLSITVLQSKKGYGLICIAKDITDVAEYKRKLEETNKKIQNILLCSADWIWKIDSEFKYITASDKVEKILGYKKSEIIGRPITDFMAQNEAKRCIHKLEKYILSKKQLTDLEVWYTTKYGRPVCIQINGIPIYTPDGKYQGFTGISKDITFLKEARRKLITAKTQAELENKQKSEFLANMSHELRTPLNAIIGVSKSLSRYNNANLNRKQLEGLKVIKEGGERLLQLINDILDLSKVEAGKMEIDIQPLAINDLIQNIEELMKQLLYNRNVDFKIKNSISTKALIYTDPLKLQQILINILGNAAKFTSSGKIELRCFQKEDNILFEAEDTGIGIEDNVLNTLFDKYKQAKDKRTQKIKGTGIGLSLSKELVQLLGGEISVKSVLNQGSIFTVCIPSNEPSSDNKHILKPNEQKQVS